MEPKRSKKTIKKQMTNPTKGPTDHPGISELRWEWRQEDGRGKSPRLDSKVLEWEN